MTTIRAAFYARVSSEQQAAAHTIESQISALSERAQGDGTPVPPERQFVDDGISGATLVRPALDRLRDLAAVGAIDRLYVHSPDRLARNYAYQVLLLDEWRRANVELVFLNRSLGQSPEDDLLLQVQGIISEYERAKLMERSRRGTLRNTVRKRQTSSKRPSESPLSWTMLRTAAAGFFLVRHSRRGPQRKKLECG
jgi:site-specific DNA recombinase